MNIYVCIYKYIHTYRFVFVLRERDRERGVGGKRDQPTHTPD